MKRQVKCLDLVSTRREEKAVRNCVSTDITGAGVAMVCVVGLAGELTVGAEV